MRIRTIETGFFYVLDEHGKDTGMIQCHITVGNKVIQRSTKTTSIQKARQFRVQLLAEAQKSGQVTPSQTVAAELDKLLTHFEREQKASFRTVRGHVAALKKVLGQYRVSDPTLTDRILEARDVWTKRGVKPVTVKRYLETLRIAVRMWGKKYMRPVPWVPLPDAPSGRRARYIPPADQVLLAEHLPTHLADLFEVATYSGVRKGQLARTKKEYVNADLKTLEWPPEETKGRKAHVLPLDERTWGLVSAWLRDGRPWCPYLFHGPRCSPVTAPSKAYGCVGDFKKAWTRSLRDSGLEYHFHDTRRTAATEMRAAGMSEEDAMKYTGHKSPYVFREYDLGDIERLRAEMAKRTEQAEQRAKERARFKR